MVRGICPAGLFSGFGMVSPFRKYGFAAVVAGVLGLAVVAVTLKGVTGEDKGGGPPTASAGGPGGGGPRGEVPRVEAGAVEQREFADNVQALGTAQARESVIIGSKVTDVISAIRFDSGDRVQKGQVLVVLSNVEQQADLNEARAALASQEREYARFTELGAKGFAPKARLEQAQAAYEQAKARVAALESRIADRTIRAPFSGVMGLRTASPGALVRPGDVIGTLDDTSVIKLDFDVPEVHLQKLKRGVKLSAQTAAYPGRTFSGEIDDVDSRISPTTRTVKVRALINNRAGDLKPGMLMTVDIQSNPRKALGVPEMALLERIDGVSVFKVVDKDGQTVVAPAKVEIGQRYNGFVEVTKGLNAGDRIVVEGVQRARPGQPVRVDDPKGDGPPGAKPATAAAPSARL